MNIKTAIIGLVIVALLGGGMYYFSMPDPKGVPEDDSSMMEKDTVGGDSMMDSSKSDESAMMKKGTIEAYGPEKLALAANGKVLLFFHANWCPVCRQLDAEAAANPNIVPDGVHVLKVDYDTETALKQKYGVTYQHTFVQVDAAGNLIAKWGDAPTYAQVFARVK